jgi:hypothetical protein
MNLLFLKELVEVEIKNPIVEHKKIDVSLDSKKEKHYLLMS